MCESPINDLSGFCSNLSWSFLDHTKKRDLGMCVIVAVAPDVHMVPINHCHILSGKQPAMKRIIRPEMKVGVALLPLLLAEGYIHDEGRFFRMYINTHDILCPDSPSIKSMS